MSYTLNDVQQSYVSLLLLQESQINNTKLSQMEDAQTCNRILELMKEANETREVLGMSLKWELWIARIEVNRDIFGNKS